MRRQMQASKRQAKDTNALAPTHPLRERGWLAVRSCSTRVQKCENRIMRPPKNQHVTPQQEVKSFGRKTWQVRPAGQADYPTSLVASLDSPRGVLCLPALMQGSNRFACVVQHGARTQTRAQLHTNTDTRTNTETQEHKRTHTHIHNKPHTHKRTNSQPHKHTNTQKCKCTSAQTHKRTHT